jgi:hypothetical protein
MGGWTYSVPVAFTGSPGEPYKHPPQESTSLSVSTHCHEMCSDQFRCECYASELIHEKLTSNNSEPLFTRQAVNPLGHCSDLRDLARACASRERRESP